MADATVGRKMRQEVRREKEKRSTSLTMAGTIRLMPPQYGSQKMYHIMRSGLTVK